MAMALTFSCLPLQCSANSMLTVSAVGNETSISQKWIVGESLKPQVLVNTCAAVSLVGWFSGTFLRNSSSAKVGNGKKSCRMILP